MWAELSGAKLCPHFHSPPRVRPGIGRLVGNLGAMKGEVEGIRDDVVKVWAVREGQVDILFLAWRWVRQVQDVVNLIVDEAAEMTGVDGLAEVLEEGSVVREDGIR